MTVDPNNVPHAWANAEQIRWLREALCGGDAGPPSDPARDPAPELQGDSVTRDGESSNSRDAGERE